MPAIQGHSPRSAGIHFRQTTRANITTICNTSKADSLDANATLTTGAFLEILIMSRQQ